MAFHEKISTSENLSPISTHPFDNATPLANSFVGHAPSLIASSSTQGFNSEEEKEHLAPTGDKSTPELTKAWKGGMDPKEVFSHEDWQKFAKVEMEALENQDDQDQNAIQFDCADLSLYLMAKYHKERGVELSYVNPISGKKISSSDEQFSTQNGFNEFVFGNVDSKSADEYSGFLGAFGAQHLHQGEGIVSPDNYPINVNGQPISYPIENLNETAPGDFGVSTWHTMPVFKVNDTTDDKVEYDSIYASGAYYGPGDPVENGRFGLGENSVMIPEKGKSTVNSAEDQFRMMRFNFLKGVPRHNQIPKLEPRPISPIHAQPESGELLRNPIPAPFNLGESSGESAYYTDSGIQSEEAKWEKKIGLQYSQELNKTDKDFESSTPYRIKLDGSAKKHLKNGSETGVKIFGELGNNYRWVNGLSDRVRGIDQSKTGVQLSYSHRLGQKSSLTGAGQFYYKNKQSVKQGSPNPKSNTKNSVGWGLSTDYKHKFDKFRNGSELSFDAGLRYAMDISTQNSKLGHILGGNAGVSIKNKNVGISISGGLEGVYQEGVNPVLNAGITIPIGKKSKGSKPVHKK